MSSLFSSVRSKPPASSPLSPFSGVSMAEIKHRSVRTNGITMHLAEQGEGPLVVLCHGFPEFWYSWRHQLPALAAAEFHAVAPDQRGYGRTDRPEPIEAYDIFQLTADIVGLVQALGEEQAVIVGHEGGAGRPVLWPAAGRLPRHRPPERAVYRPRDNVRPPDLMQFERKRR